MTTNRASTITKAQSAIALLTADHSKVKKMFKQFEKLHEAGSGDEARGLAQKICDELTIHATVEEEIFYPPVRAAINDSDMMNEAEVEHSSAKDLIAQIEAMDASDDKFAPTVTVLGEYIQHHAGEEEREMFPKARKTKLDFAKLGQAIEMRKAALKSEMGIEDEHVAEAPKKRSRSKL